MAQVASVPVGTCAACASVVMFTTLMSWSLGLALPSSWRSICEKAL